MKADIIEEIIELPEAVKVQTDHDIVVVEGPKGKLEKKLLNPRVTIEVKDGKVRIFAKKASKREKMFIGTFNAHINNMVRGVQDEYVYKLKICSGHFPMNVSVNNKEFIVKNFFGEKIPRVLKLRDGVDVKVQGDEVEVKSIDKDLAGQTAASIEQLTKRTKYDHRIFQDGIYITLKAK